LRGDQVWIATRTPGRPEQGTFRLGGASGLRPKAQLAQATPDIVHCHSSVLSPLAWMFARAAATAGVPVVLTMHSMVPTLGPVATGLRVLARSIGPDAVWTAVSDVCAAAMRRAAGVPVHVLNNGVDPQAWASEPRDPAAVTTVSSVMRLASRKRPLAFIDMLAKVEGELGPDARWRAVIAGDGPLRDTAARAVRRHRLTHRVSLPGRLDRDQVRVLMSRTDLYVAPATLESFGIAALEARCAGAPVLAMRATGVSEFIQHGVDGLLVEDDRRMTGRLVDLLSERSQLSELSAGAASPVVEQAWPTVTARCAEVYRVAGTCEAGRRQPALIVQ